MLLLKASGYVFIIATLLSEHDKIKSKHKANGTAPVYRHFTISESLMNSHLEFIFKKKRKRKGSYKTVNPIVRIITNTTLSFK